MNCRKKKRWRHRYKVAMNRAAAKPRGEPVSMAVMRECVDLDGNVCVEILRHWYGCRSIRNRNGKPAMRRD